MFSVLSLSLGNLIPGYHPHGFISLGAFGNFATEGTGFENKFPGITNSLLTLNGNFRLPLYSEFLQALGLASVSRRSCEALLYSLLLKVGLIQEKRSRKCDYDCRGRSRGIITCETRGLGTSFEKATWIY